MKITRVEIQKLRKEVGASLAATFKANFGPGLFVQTFAIALVLLFYFVPATTPFFQVRMLLNFLFPFFSHPLLFRFVFIYFIFYFTNYVLSLCMI
jgi:hypothetical protein